MTRRRRLARGTMLPPWEPAIAPSGSPDSDEQETHRSDEIGEGMSEFVCTRK
jgi:hypothetical protein